MAASTPSRSATSGPRPASGSHEISSSAAALRRTLRNTLTSAEPMSPDDPVMTIFMSTSRRRPSQCWVYPRSCCQQHLLPTTLWAARSGLKAEIGFEAAFLETCLDRAKEPCGVAAVDQPVVVGEREVHHRPDRDRLAEVGVVDDDGPFHDSTGAENADLGRQQDRRVEQRPAAAGV